MSFNTKLIDLLKTDPRFVDDDSELVLVAVQDRAWKIDRNLVKLLLSCKEIKAKFFEEIEGHWIFNTNTFIDYISQKNFLDNSYTRFRNRIGLTVDGKYLRERGDVALVWPYKDCVLEGGQTKEEEKRKEIFFNEVLAQDEINRLLDPKVLTNFVRMLDRQMQKLQAQYEQIYLLRNEGHFAIYNFTDGQAFQPDFVLFLREKSGKLLIYQLFIEPKGRHLKEHDHWKETFLKEITSEFDGKPLTFEDEKYRLTGVPFYNNEDENQFRASLDSVLN